MQLILLGTGTSQGIPVIACKCKVCNSGDPRDRRLRSSAFLKIHGRHILIDAGPDLRQQVLREGIDRIDAVLLTHAHKDHTAGLDELRSFNFAQNAAIDIYASAEVHDTVRKEFSYAFSEDPYPGVPDFNQIEIANSNFDVCGIEFIPVHALHLAMPVTGFRTGSFAYLTDLSSIEENELRKLYNLDVLVISALRKEPHYSHLNLDQALALIEKIKPGNAYLTHMSHLMGFHKELVNELPENVHAAYEGLIIDIQSDL